MPCNTDASPPIDKNGREILPGDTLKVFHFIGARRKRHYMYKFVKCIKANRLVISHLSLSESGWYCMAMNGKQLMDHEIVQGFNGGIPFEDRARLTQ